MNYLAHALLADFAAPLRAGSATGDFFKGPLAPDLPADFARGIRLHRAIDRYADSHPAFRASRTRLPANIRRWSGVIVDLYYDHILARQWADWHPQPLTEFSQSLYHEIAAYRHLMDEGAQGACRLMAREDWLSGYSTAAGLATTLQRMGRRVRRENPLAGADVHLGGDAAGFADDCRAFLVDARAFAVDWLSCQASESANPTAPDPAPPDSD
ncbi:MAG TPA: ACP phosphodiesterase [Rhodocyclaceae bacterium]